MKKREFVPIDPEHYVKERLGLHFNDLSLLHRALTHRSFVNENAGPPIADNERLEFLGDAVLDFLVGEWLYTQFPESKEGVLTRLRSGLVRTETLAELANQTGIGELIRMGRGESAHGGRERLRTLCGAFEALCGALFLDRGIEAVRQFVLPLLQPQLDRILEEQSDKDAKSRLQEWAHVALNQTPEYVVLETHGPEHARVFTVEVRLGDQILGTGRGSSKRRAEQVAARQALNDLPQPPKI